MRLRTRVILLAAAAAALALPSVAAAKGPSKASITGPGLSAPVSIGGDGEGDTTTDLGLLVNVTGFFPQTFGQSPDPLLRSKPNTKLGARYVVAYTVPGPSTDTLLQDLYPYAVGGAVSYMKPGQKIWSQTTHGGWYRAGGLSGELKVMLVRAGLPKTAPASIRSRAASQTKNISIAVGAGAGIALAAGAAVLLRRKR
jgi:hypothetical protein